MHPSGRKVLAARVEAGRVVLTCRRGAADALTIYARRDSEPEYIPLEEGDDPVVDDRPKLDPARPEVRRYFAMLLYSGEENRMKSNEIVLTVP